MKWSVRFLLRNFRKESKSKNKKRVAITVRKRDKETSERDRLDIKKSRKNRKKNDLKKSREKENIKRNRKKNSIRWFWNRKSHEIESRISSLALDRETKRHRHRDIETISNDCHSISKIIFFDRWYRWDHRRIKQTKTTNFNTSQRNFHEIVETLKSFIFCERLSLLRQRKQRRQRF